MSKPWYGVMSEEQEYRVRAFMERSMRRTWNRLFTALSVLLFAFILLVAASR